MGRKIEAAHECSESEEKDKEFSRARQLLVDLIGLPDLQKVFDEEVRGDAKRVYTQTPTLMLLIQQRLGGGLSLTAVVQALLAHHRDLLSVNRRVREQMLSATIWLNEVNRCGRVAECSFWTAPRSHCRPLPH
jgi:hypothetical protein